MKYIKTFEEFVNESTNNEEIVTEGKISDIEKEIEELTQDHDNDPDVIADAEAGSGKVGYKKYFKRIEKLQDRIEKFLTKKSEYEKELKLLEDKIHELESESEILSNKVRDNENTLKTASDKNFSFNGLWNDNKKLIIRIREINLEMKEISKQREKIYDKINNI